MRLSWTARARDDLQDIHDYLLDTNPGGAERIVDDLIAHADVLLDHPLIGRLVPELSLGGLRELIRGSYRIIYTASSEAVIVIGVWHAARDLTGGGTRQN